MTVMFCHPTDESGVMAAEEGGGEEEGKMEKGVSRRRTRKKN